MTRMLLSIPSMKFNMWSSSSWLEEINESQDGIYFTLSGFYALVSAMALIQLIRIEIRLPEYGWTIQKVFQLLNFIVYGVRAIVFGFHMQVLYLHPKVCIWVLLEVPGLLFFSTYTLLVLHWAGIYNQARSLPTDKLKTTYAWVNLGVYVVQSCIWIYRWVDDSSTVHFVGKLSMSVVSFMAALGFLLYGGRLFFMLRRYPVGSEGKKRKLREFGAVATICFTFFVVRYFVDVLSAFDYEVSLDVLGHPVLNLIFYMSTANGDPPFSSGAVHIKEAAAQESFVIVASSSLGTRFLYNTWTWKHKLFG